MHPIAHQLQHRLIATICILAVALAPSIREVTAAENRGPLLLYLGFLVWLVWQFSHIFTENETDAR